MNVVVDNSVALAWCFTDEHTTALIDLLYRVTETGAVAPSLWPLEALNGLLVAERRGRLNAGQRAELAKFLHELPFLLDDETADRTWEGTARLAARFRLSAYDASYLELAERRRLPLATLDRDLRDAAASLGLEVLGAG